LGDPNLTSTDTHPVSAMRRSHQEGAAMSDDRARDGNNRYIRTETEVEQDAEAARLRAEGLSYRAIAQTLGCSVSAAHGRVQRAWRAILQEPAEQARAVELARLEDAHDAALAVLLREHLTVSHGKVITTKNDAGDDVPLIDDAPVLAAIDRIRALSESRRKLLGLDAPARVSVDAEHLGQEIAEILNTLAYTAAHDDQPPVD
jgi:transposase